MIKALLLVIRPVKAWEQVLQAQRSPAWILATFLLPLLLLTGAAEGWGLVKWGEQQLDVTQPRHFSMGQAVAFEVMQLIVSLVIVFVGAIMIKSLSGTFHSRHTIKQTFTVVAYGLSPLFTLRLLDAFPVNPWIAWAIGFFLSAGVLYQGVPKVMQPDPPQAFGLFVASVIQLGIVTALARFVTAWYLQGRFESHALLPPDLTLRMLFS